MPQIQKLVVGQMQTNCYLITDKSTQQTLIIDPGDDANYIIQTIQQNHLSPTQIIATHGHFDHILAAAQLQLIFNIPLFIHQKDEFLVKTLTQRASFFLSRKDTLVPVITPTLKENDQIHLGAEKSFLVMETPGHTPGSLSLYCSAEKILFSGDLIFAGGGVGRTDFSYSSKQKLQKSLQKILSLPSQTTLYPGHGPQFQLGKFKRVSLHF